MEGKYGKRYFSGVHGWESFFIAIISIAQQWHNHEDENRLKDLLISAKMKTTRKMSYNEKFSAFMCMFFYCLHSSSSFFTSIPARIYRFRFAHFYMLSPTPAQWKQTFFFSSHWLPESNWIIWFSFIYRLGYVQFILDPDGNMRRK